MDHSQYDSEFFADADIRTADAGLLGYDPR